MKIKKSILFLLSIAFFVSMHSMEVKLFENKKKKEVEVQIPENFKKITHAPEGGAIVSQGEIFNKHIYLNLQDRELFTTDTFKSLIEGQNNKKCFFILAMLTTVGGANHKDTINFYGGCDLNTYFKQDKQHNRYSPNVYIDPINNQQIVDRIKYFTIDSLDGYFKYLGSDYDLFMGDKKKNKFMQSCFKASNNNPQAMFNLGLMYFKGHGVKTDYGEAFKCYEKAAQLNDPKALINLGLMYFEGHGVKKDYGEAFKYYKKAAQLGNPTALINLGSMYFEGHGVKKDYGEAFKYYNKAAEKGDAGSWCNLGLMYKNGFGVEKNLEMAKFCLRKAKDKDSNKEEM